MKQIRVRDLKNQTGTDGPRPFLYCMVCQGQYSANAGDYFMWDDDEVMRCCKRPMVLVTAKRGLTEVEA